MPNIYDNDQKKKNIISCYNMDKNGKKMKIKFKGISTSDFNKKHKRFLSHQV